MLGGRAYGGAGFGGPVGIEARGNGRISRGDFGPGRGRDFDPGYGDLPDPKRQRLLEPPIGGGAAPFFGGPLPARGAPLGPGFGPSSGGGPPGVLPGRREFPVVKLRGLPFRATEVDIVEFFHGLDVVDVLLVRSGEGDKFTGDAFVVFGAPMQIQIALQRNRQHMGPRYVEVFPTKKADYYKAVAEDVRHGGPVESLLVQDLGPPPRRGFASGPGGPPPPRGPLRDDHFRERESRVRDRSSDRDRRDYPERPRAPPPARSAPPQMQQAPANERVADFTVIKLRGLPYTASKLDIIEFFGEFGLNEDSLHIVTSADGRSTGEAFAEFHSTGDARRALEKNKQRIGARYVELFPSSREEATRAATSSI